MRLDQLTSIAVWNLNRGNINYNKVDFDLEARMLSEERVEYYTAYDAYLDSNIEDMTEEFFDIITEMVDAIADYQFVYGGTVAKISRAHNTMPDNRQIATLTSIAQNDLNIMIQILVDLVAPYGVLNLDECLDMVIEANEAKGTEKIDGKIQKGPDWVDPKVTIKNYIKDTLKIPTQG
mgnify:CR=1 FL=1